MCGCISQITLIKKPARLTLVGRGISQIGRLQYKITYQHLNFSTDQLLPQHRCVLPADDRGGACDDGFEDAYHIRYIDAAEFIAGPVVAGVVIVAGHDGMGRNTLTGKRKIIGPLKKIFAAVGFHTQPDVLSFQVFFENALQAGTVGARYKKSVLPGITMPADHFNIDHGLDGPGVEAQRQLV